MFTVQWKLPFPRSPGYFLWAPDNLNVFSISLEGSSNRESTVSPYHRLPNHIFFFSVPSILLQEPFFSFLGEEDKRSLCSQGEFPVK